MRRALVLLAIAAGSLLVSHAAAPSAHAEPPSYLLLRRPESPQHAQPGAPPASYYDVRTYGYAYGFFGVAPRSHCSHHHGINRIFTQWSKW
jgi:hypothetical protein